MRKILGLILMVGVFGMSTFASDNISIPNTFSSGSTISSSKMNENFELIKNKLNQLLQTLKLVQNGKMNIDQPGEYTVNFVNQFDSNPIITVSTNEHGWCGVKEVNTSSFKIKCYYIKESAGTGFVLEPNNNPYGNSINIYWSATEE